jgi:tRNA(Ile)-lysidine synthase
VAGQDGVRLLRPLLAVPKARLRATLEAIGQPWVEDPSNRDPRHARVRWRALLPQLAAEGLTGARLAATARRLGEARQALELSTARLLAEAAALHPAGYVTLALAPLRAAPAETGRRALARCLLTVGGGDYTPRLERLDRLYDRVLEPAWPAQTLAGCRVVKVGQQALICREPGRVQGPLAAPAGARVRWDGRFVIALASRKGRDGVPAGAVIAALGSPGWARLTSSAPGLRRHAVPGAVRPSLPALWHRDHVLEVPGVGWRAAGRPPALVRSISFAPRHPLAGPSFGMSGALDEASLPDTPSA